VTSLRRPGSAISTHRALGDDDLLLVVERARASVEWELRTNRNPGWRGVES
jgi:hypothetical protein